MNCLKGRLDSLFVNNKYCDNWEESEWSYIWNDCNSIQDEWQLHALWTVTDDDDDDYWMQTNTHVANDLFLYSQTVEFRSLKYLLFCISILL